MLWIIACAVAALFLALLYYCYRQAFWVDQRQTVEPCIVPPGNQYDCIADRILSLIRSAKEIPCEKVSIRSHDGLLLKGRYYESAPGAPLQIMFHGYRSNPIRDFSGGMQLALRSGCNVLLVSQRAHEGSEGRCLSFGILERLDCLDWLHYANDRFGADTPVFLVGISMGAATVLMASELELTGNVRGIISDCGYSSPRAIIRKVLSDMHYPVSVMYPLIRLSGRIFGGFDVESASPVEALKHCRVPVLFIHGDDDRFVPFSMSAENYEACASEKRMAAIHDAGHAICYMVDEAAYTEAVQSFLREHLTAGGGKTERVSVT